MNVCESLSVTARWFPDTTAMFYNDQRLSFAEANSLSYDAGEALRQAGIQRGDRVALMLPNTPAFAVWYYAALRLGALAVSINNRLSASEVAFVLGDCGAAAIVAVEADLQGLQGELPGCCRTSIATTMCGQFCNGGRLNSEIPPGQATWVDAEPDEAALILYTSGTTGFPKGATLSHRNIRSNVAAFNHLCNMKPEDRILLAVPLFHCFGQNALLNSAWNVGATLVLQQRFDPHEARQLILDRRITQFYGVPMMFQLLLDVCDPADLASVDYCFSAAATLPIRLSHAWQAKFEMPIHEGYGLTETSPFASYNHRTRYTPGSIGTPIDSVEMRIVDPETGEACAPGQLGEIAIRGPNVMLGYWNRPKETAAVLREGWFYSGDIGRRDEDGFFYITDRVKDMISVGGLKVFPAEVERILLEHPAVAQAAVVGIPDPIFGEQVVAVVVLAAFEPDAEQKHIDEIVAFAKTHLGNYKLPRRIVCLQELPRNPAGKILKNELRKLFNRADAAGFEALAREPTADGLPPRPAAGVRKPPSLRNELAAMHKSERPRHVIRYLQKLVCEIAGLGADPDVETSFLNAGLDSLMLVELGTQLQVEVGRRTELPPTLAFDYPRISSMAEFLLQTLYSEETTTPPASDTQPASRKTKPKAELYAEIEEMSEEDALRELIKELHD